MGQLGIYTVERHYTVPAGGEIKRCVRNYWLTRKLLTARIVKDTPLYTVPRGLVTNPIVGSC